MKRLMLAAMAAWMLATTGTLAQQPRPAAKPDKQSSLAISLGQLSPTAEMWFYEQAWQHYSDPKMMVRRKAEIAAAQRQQRIAAREWYGISLARPNASVTPMTGNYSPSWVGNTRNPNQWAAPNGPVIFTSSRPVYGMW